MGRLHLARGVALRLELAASVLALAAALAAGGARAQAVATHIASDGSTGTAVGQFAANGYVIDGGTRAGANLFHSFTTFDLASGDVAVWFRSAGDGAQIANIINRVTGGDVSHINGTLTSQGLPNAAFWFINPAGIVFGQGASINVPNAAHFSTAQSLLFADGAVFTTATPTGSTFSVSSPAAFGFVGGQGDIVVNGVVDQQSVAFDPSGAALQFSARNVVVTNSVFNVFSLDAAAVGTTSTTLDADHVSAAAAGNGTLLVTGSLLDSFAVSSHGGGVGLAGAQVLLQGGAGSGVFTFANGPLRGGDLTVSAGLLDIEGGSALSAQASNGGAGGNVMVGANQVTVGPAGSIVAATSGTAAGGWVTVNAGQIALTGAIVSLAQGSGAGGDVVLNAPDLQVTGGVVRTSAAGAGRAGGIAIDAPSQLVVNNGGQIVSATAGAGAAGAIDISAGAMTVTTGGLITSGGLAGSSGSGGDVTVDAVSLLVGPAAPGGQTGATGAIGTNTLGSGSVGALTVSADDLHVSGGQIASVSSSASKTGKVRLTGRNTLVIDNGGLVTSSTTGPGDAGALTLMGGDITISGHAIVSTRTFPGTTGQAGALSISGRSLTVDAAFVGSTTTSSADAGALTIDAGAVTVRNGGLISSDTAGGTGNAGQLGITANSVTVLSGADISSSSLGAGHAGTVLIQAGAVTVDDAGILSSAFSTGDGGAVGVTANQMTVRNQGIVTTDTSSSGRAGSVTLEVGTLSLTGSSHVSSSTEGSGTAGVVTVTAQSVAIDHSVLLSTTSGGGAAGDVNVAAQTLALTNAGTISSSAEPGSSGAAGQVVVQAPALTIDDGLISSETFGSGDAGGVRVVSNTLRLKNAGEISSSASACFDGSCVATGDAGTVSVRSGSISLTDGSSIQSETFGPGRAGALTLISNTLDVGADAAISSVTFGSGNAGSIAITAGALTLENGGRILSSQANALASGDAGSIAITAKTIAIGADPLGKLGVSTSIFNTGKAGSITLNADKISLDGGGVGSSARGLVAGTSGDVAITTGDLELIHGARIETVSVNPDKAGAISVTSPLIGLDDASQITSANLSAAGGAAGSIQLTGTAIRLLNGGDISTNSTAGAAGDIVLTMPVTGELQLAGDTLPGVITTSSGPGTGGRITISAPYLILSQGGRILALGEQGGANVRIAAAYFISSADRVNLVSVDGSLIVDSQVGDLSTGAQLVDLSFLDASAVLRGQCAAAGGAGRTSRLSVRAAGPYALGGQDNDRNPDAADAPRGRGAPSSSGCLR